MLDACIVTSVILASTTAGREEDPGAKPVNET
jgi:hypothetical protein